MSEGSSSEDDSPEQGMEFLEAAVDNVVQGAPLSDDEDFNERMNAVTDVSEEEGEMSAEELMANQKRIILEEQAKRKAEHTGENN